MGGVGIVTRRAGPGWLERQRGALLQEQADHVIAVTAPDDAPETIDRVNGVLASERIISIATRPLEATSFEAGGNRMDYVLYESGLSINVMFGMEDESKRAVGFKLSGGTRRTGRDVQNRPAEVEAGRRHSWNALPHQGRVPRSATRRRPG